MNHTRTLGSFVVCWAVAACSGAVVSKPDPRLGALVLEADAQAYTTMRSRARIVVSASGDAYALVTLNTARTFATSKTVPATTVFKKVSPGGAVSSLPSPIVPSEIDRAFTSLRMGGDGTSVLLSDIVTNLGVGALLRLQLFDGTSWTAVSLLRTDLPVNDRGTQWTVKDDQVRLLSKNTLVVQHNDLLTRFDTTWKAVQMPKGAKEVRLGTASATQVRVYWLTTDGTLQTDVLNGDGTWVGTIASLKRGVAPTLKGVSGFAGSLERFTLQFAASNQQVFVIRHENGVLTQVTQRPPLPGELDGTSFLLPTPHPSRQVFFSSTGTLETRIDGVPTGSAGEVPGLSGLAPVSCPATCTVVAGEPVATAPECATCFPRSIRLTEFAVAPDLESVHAMYVDELQDATFRFYVKRYPLPNASSVVDPSGPFTGFPGENGVLPDGGVFSPDRVEVSGTILLAGATTHDATTLQLTKGATPVESIVTNADGSFSFSAVTPGSFTVTASHPGYTTQIIEVVAPLPGPQRIQRVLRTPGVLDVMVSPGAETLAQGAELLQRDGAVLSTTRAVLSTALASTDVVRAKPTVMWTENNNLCVGRCTSVIAGATFDSVRILGGTGSGNGPAVAEGVPDGATPLVWRFFRSGGSIRMLVPPAVDVAHFDTGCTSALIFSQVTPGDVRATRSRCATTTWVELDAPTQSAAPVAPMKALTILDNNTLFGFAGLSCGAEAQFQTNCPVQTLNRQGPVVATVISAGAIDAQVLNQPTRRVVVLEASNGLGTLKLDGVVIKSDIALPSSWGPNETPMTVFEFASRIVVRTPSGLFESTTTPNSWTQVLPDVVRVVRVPRINGSSDRMVIWQAAPGQSTCAAGCKLFSLLGSGAPVLISARANGNERLFEQGVLSDASPFVCPDGQPCTLVQFTRFTGEVTPFGPGTLFPDVVANPRVFGASQDVLGGTYALFTWPQATVRVSPPN